MPKLIPAPTTIPAPGQPPKRIDEYVGRLASGDETLSVAHMRSPDEGGAEYIAVCLPAFSPATVHRDD